ncbi:MAG: hypothetical protein HW408_1571 [Actinobacteria bacterium]|nr:hypothetical protein [Actinomycetota bacterium]
MSIHYYLSNIRTTPASWRRMSRSADDAGPARRRPPPGGPRLQGHPVENLPSQEENDEPEEEAHHQRWRPRRRQPEHHDRRSPRAGAAAGRLVPGEARPLRPGGDPRTPHARQGVRRLRHLHRHPRHHQVRQGQDLLEGRQEDRPIRALLHRCRRARRGRRRARHPRLRDEVLHRGRKLGSGGEQHAGVLYARSAQVPRSQPRRQAGPPQQPAQRPQQLGLLRCRRRCTRSRSP